MGMMSCTECGKQVSHDAKLCPHCGTAWPALTADQKVSVSNTGKWVSIIFFFAFLIAMIAMFKK